MASIAGFTTALRAALTTHFTGWRVVDKSQAEPADSKTIVVEEWGQQPIWTGIDTVDTTFKARAVFFSRTRSDCTGLDIGAFLLAYPQSISGYYRLRVEEVAEHHSGLDKEEYAHELAVIFTADSR